MVNNLSTVEKNLRSIAKRYENIKEDDFFTSAIATAKYIAKNYSERKCFMIGESGLEEALIEFQEKFFKHKIIIE